MRIAASSLADLRGPGSRLHSLTGGPSFGPGFRWCVLRTFFRIFLFDAFDPAQDHFLDIAILVLIQEGRSHRTRLSGLLGVFYFLLRGSVVCLGHFCVRWYMRGSVRQRILGWIVTRLVEFSFDFSRGLSQNMRR